MQDRRPQKDADPHIADQRRQLGQPGSSTHVKCDNRRRSQKRQTGKMQKGQIGSDRKNYHLQCLPFYVLNEPAA